jgi:hypothetical protein
MSTTHLTPTTPTEAIAFIRDRHANGEHGTFEMPCHVAPGSDATPADVLAKFEDGLDILDITAAVEFDGALLTVII